MDKKLNYITYQTFPANTANSIQTISTLKHLNRLGLRVALIYPLRNKDSSDNIDLIRNNTNFKMRFNLLAQSTLSLSKNLRFSKSIGI